MAIAEQSLLGCGRPIDQVWEHVDEPPDEHEAHCPDCQRARRSLAKLDEATSALRSSDENDPDLAPPPIMKKSIMELARAEVRRGQRLPLLPPARADLPPELSISEQAVASVVRFAADGLAGLHARRCTVRLDRSSPAEPEPSEPELIEPELIEKASARPAVRVVIDLGVALSSSSPLLEITQTLRSRIRDVVPHDTGMGVSKVNITVEDLFDV